MLQVETVILVFILIHTKAYIAIFNFCKFYFVFCWIFSIIFFRDRLSIWLNLVIHSVESYNIVLIILLIFAHYENKLNEHYYQSVRSAIFQ